MSSESEAFHMAISKPKFENVLKTVQGNNGRKCLSSPTKGNDVKTMLDKDVLASFFDFENQSLVYGIR